MRVTIAGVVLALCAGVILAAMCVDPQAPAALRVDRLPKASASAVPAAPVPPSPAKALRADAAGLKRVVAALAWDLPESWTLVAQGGNSIRLASFAIPAYGGDVSLLVLGGTGGGLAANINRWRGQIGLPPVSPAAIEAAVQAIATGLGPASWLAMSNPARPDQAMLATIVPIEDRTIFVKALLPAAALDASEADFLAFCRSLRPGDDAEAGP